jgi:hypothetical protein
LDIKGKRGFQGQKVGRKYKIQLNTDGRNRFGHHDRLNHVWFWWVKDM